MKHRKGSVARKIQDYFLSGGYEMVLNGDFSWCWFPIPNNQEFCVALEWQNGYEGDQSDKEFYGIFGQEDGNDFYVLNASIKMTDEFSINGEYALYAESYFYTDKELQWGLTGGTSLSKLDKEENFYTISKYMAEQYLEISRRKRLKY